MTVTALIVAAGRGARFGADNPKQYAVVGGRSILNRTVGLFACHGDVDAVRVVIHPDDRQLYDAAVADFDLMEPVNGGASRQQSVRLGLESLADAPPDKVLIHDAARPFAGRDGISQVIDALDEAPGAILGLPVVDTLKRQTDAATVSATVTRDGLWRAQTPQGFRFADILAAHRDVVGQDLTDDAAVAESAGLVVALIAGLEDNLKITTQADLARAERMIRAQLSDIRTGQGFDAHRFAADAPEDGTIKLGGIAISHDRALAGHSDADVALHAVTDALLGAIGDRDIGHHFPPSDEKWQGASSDQFAGFAARQITERGGLIAHVDLTLICERPKIGPHRDAMRQRVAEILAIPLERVSIKATTTEKMGFTGRGEGIAAQAVATVRLP